MSLIAADDEESLLPDRLRADRRGFVHKSIYEAADWYDVDYAAYRAELTFYRLLLGRHARGSVVVELGAGTGRLTVPLAEAGVDDDDGWRVHAVEPSAPMRERLVAKLATSGLQHAVVVEDAIAADFAGPVNSAGDGAPIGLVIFAFNGVLHLDSRAALHASLRHIHQKLADDGVFALDMTPPYWETLLRGHVPWGRIDERVHPTSGRTFLTCDRSSYDPATRVTRIDIRYAYDDDDAADPGTQIALRQHMWTTPEILQSLDDCGFVVDACFGDVDLSTFDEGSPRLLVSAKKKRKT